MRRLWLSVCVALLLLVAIGLLFALWLAIDLAQEGITARLIQFQSTPREGWAYWEGLERRQAVKGAIVPGLIWLMLFALVVGAMGTTTKRLFTGKRTISTD